MNLEILTADYELPQHREAVVRLLEAYADDPQTGGGQPLSDQVRATLVDGLRDHPTSLVLLAAAEQEHGEGQMVGLAVCFEGYSTFAARPLLNLHDLVVHRDWRGKGVGSELLRAVETHARRRNCVCITLEVLGSNQNAQRLYQRHGYVGGRSIEPTAAAMFWKKQLD